MILNRREPTIRILAIAVSLAILSSASVGDDSEKPNQPAPKGKAPAELPKVPAPDAKAAWVPKGFRVEVVMQNLIYPSSIEFDNRGAMYLAEAGAAFGDQVAPARVTRIVATGPAEKRLQVVAKDLSGPVTDLLWHNGRLYISHRGKISVLEGPLKVKDLVADLPSMGDHSNNQMCVGPDGKIYFGQGTATNSGVVGLDSFMMGWLKKNADFHDTAPRDILLHNQVFTAPDPITLFTGKKMQMVKTAPFQSFGRAVDASRTENGEESGVLIKAARKANGTILRMNPDGSAFEVYAWGLRNPFGICWGPDKRLYASDNGYDERGSRPIANAPDMVWVINQGAWYGWPDFAAGEPVTDERFKSKRGPAPKFLMAKHPPVEKPLTKLPGHAGAAGIDFGRNPRFGKQLFVALVGDVTPMTGENEKPAGFEVVRIDPETGNAETFFKTAENALGPKGMEYVATAGPKRPVDVHFSPDGGSLYVVDAGAIALVPSAVGPMMRPFPGSGAVWRIVPEN